jgi:hypothetical protein
MTLKLIRPNRVRALDHPLSVDVYLQFIRPNTLTTMARAPKPAEDAADKRRKEAMEDMLVRLGFSKEAANDLVYEQLVNDVASILEFSDTAVLNLSKAVRKPGGGEDGHIIPELAVSRFQLVVFYIKHQYRTYGPIHIPGIHLELVKEYKEQMIMEKEWMKKNPEHKLDLIPLDAGKAPVAFDQLQTILHNMRGSTGMPLSYMIRHKLFPAPMEPSPGHPDSPYATYDDEIIGCGMIILEGRSNWDLDALDEYEQHGPFANQFKIDARKVWTVLHAVWGSSSVWTHVKKFDKEQNGRKAYRALYAHFFGGSRATTMTTAIHTRLRNLTYTGDMMNYNFDKYVANHVSQHNTAANLVEFGGAELEENLKINYFMTGIKCGDLDTVKNGIVADPIKYNTFDAMKDHFIEYRCMLAVSRPAPTRSVASIQRPNGGDRGGGGNSNSTGGGGGKKKNGTPAARKKGLPSQDKIDKCTQIKNKYYPKEEYDKFTDAEKQKLWQLQHPKAVPGTDDTKTTTPKCKVAAMNSAMHEDESDDNASLFPDSDDDKDVKKVKEGGNRSNKALKCK